MRKQGIKILLIMILLFVLMIGIHSMAVEWKVFITDQPIILV